MFSDVWKVTVTYRHKNAVHAFEMVQIFWRLETIKPAQQIISETVNFTNINFRANYFTENELKLLKKKIIIKKSIPKHPIML